MTFAAASEKRDQLVPNWKGMTIPVTTPIPKATEKMRVQKLRDSEPDIITREEEQALERGYVGGEAHGEGGQQDVPADNPSPLETGQEQRVKVHGASPFLQNVRSASSAGTLAATDKRAWSGVPAIRVR